MRTNIEIEDDLLAAAMDASGLKTKKATIEEALKRLVENHRLHKAIEDIKGIGWDGDLNAMREGWSHE